MVRNESAAGLACCKTGFITAARYRVTPKGPWITILVRNELAAGLACCKTGFITAARYRVIPKGPSTIASVRNELASGLARRLSSAIFRGKMTAVVKKAMKEKVGKQSDYVVIFYVNQTGYPQRMRPVEKGCGKVCGECGKVRVFNRYSGGLEFFNRSRWMHNRMHNRTPRSMKGALCCRGQPRFSSESLTKKLAIFQNEEDRGGCERGMAKNICENHTKKTMV